MTPTRRAATFFAALGLTVALAACGGEDKPDPIPSGDPTPEVSVSPPPEDAPELDSEQQEAFDTAVNRYADFEDFNARIAEDPQTSQEIADELYTYTVEPATTDWAESLDQLIADGIRIEGRRKVEWSSPVEVTADQVVFRQCESPGTWTAYQGDESSPQTNNIVTQVTVVKVDDTWLIKDQEGDGEC